MNTLDILHVLYTAQVPVCVIELLILKRNQRNSEKFDFQSNSIQEFFPKTLLGDRLSIRAFLLGSLLFCANCSFSFDDYQFDSIKIDFSCSFFVSLACSMRCPVFALANFLFFNPFQTQSTLQQCYDFQYNFYSNLYKLVSEIGFMKNH